MYVCMYVYIYMCVCVQKTETVPVPQKKITTIWIHKKLSAKVQNGTETFKVPEASGDTSSKKPLPEIRNHIPPDGNDHISDPPEKENHLPNIPLGDMLVPKRVVKVGGERFEIIPNDSRNKPWEVGHKKDSNFCSSFDRSQFASRVSISHQKVVVKPIVGKKN